LQNVTVLWNTALHNKSIAQQQHCAARKAEITMRRVWTDGSSALKPHRYSYYDNQFHRRVDVEYVRPPLKQSENTDLENQIIKSKPKAKPQEEPCLRLAAEGWDFCQT
jgi:hypothetical protein